ncbi:hypothetical protein D3C85_1482180 [compost metagenome]
MGRCCLFHLLKRVINVAAVKLVVAAHVDHRMLECFVRPLHASRFRIDVACEDDNVRIARGGIESSELVVQVRIDLELHRGHRAAQHSAHS